ncbi:biopolymer transporter ExbD [Ornithobacterium rhinotracheale]|uniref:ExbD/TolR family protein n=1 Tax=Ornithobacterium rhinotracheale TaxID=28251 RepID=UPI00129C988F|nr:biopolymer transporter ExbD [Ornithobacterium rhinotracheale]MRJ08859.1 biopolymer transporter ExbD [Ornithobacterium rhinotracheale]UOH77740.1 biopolymer transporter ExbD [Ornithobacterium rhinotracheale]
MAKKKLPEINASSMADIAFLLLTFFLIASSMEKSEGIQRQLPDMSKDTKDVTIKVEQRNAIEFVANAYGQILYKENPSEVRQVNLKEVKELVRRHVDNGGGVDKDGQPCNYCQGERRPDLSAHPSLAIVSVKFDKGTSWKDYMALQGEIEAAYEELKAAYVKRAYNRDWETLIPNPTKGDDEGDNAIIKDANSRYPKIIAEPKPSDASQ